MKAWARGITLLRVEGDGVGALRFVDSPIGLFVERYESHDDAGRALSYSIVESPWKLDSYLASVRVVAMGPKTCTVEWSCEFAAESGSAADFKARFERIYRSFIANLRAAAAAKAG